MAVPRSRAAASASGAGWAALGSTTSAAPSSMTRVWASGRVAPPETAPAGVHQRGAELDDARLGVRAVAHHDDVAVGDPAARCRVHRVHPHSPGEPALLA